MIGKSMWVSCDGDASGILCDREVVLQGSEATGARVRAAARAAGWVHTKEGLDLCPEHKRGGDRS